MKQNSWFSVSGEGWRRLNAGREMGHLIREGISNSLDQENITNITLTVEPGHVTIEDDSPTGIKTPDLISVIFLTDKEDSHLKRGRKGRGLKELVSIADKAIIETVGYTTTFDENGRTEQPNTRTVGTKLEIWSSLETWQQPVQAIEYLKKIISPKTLIINGKEVKKPVHLRKIGPYQLQTTIIEDSIQKTIYENTMVDLYEINGKKGWIYEMGIPIQEIDCPYLIDVAQRIPMNDNRDVVDYYYITSIQGLIVDGMIDALTDRQLKEEWVTAHPFRLSTKTKQVLSARLVGDTAVLASEDKHADDLVRQHGFKVIKTTTMSSGMREILQNVLPESIVVAEKIAKSTPSTPVTSLDNDQEKYKEVVEWLGKKILGKDITCCFYGRAMDHTGMYEQATYGGGVVSFNVLCPGNDFSKPLGEDSLACMTHEFAHVYADLHDENFQKEVERMSGKLASTIILNYDELKEKFGSTKMRKGKTTFITCVDCAAQREVKVQDAFQVKRCKKCQEIKKRKKNVVV